MAGSRAEAEDLVQEAFARALSLWDRVGRMPSPTGYVYRIALNLHRSRLRALRRRRGRPVAAEEADPRSDAALRVELRDALQSLSPDQRDALVLVEWVGLSSEEAGAALGSSPPACEDASTERGNACENSWRTTMPDLKEELIERATPPIEVEFGLEGTAAALASATCAAAGRWSAWSAWCSC